MAFENVGKLKYISIKHLQLNLLLYFQVYKQMLANSYVKSGM